MTPPNFMFQFLGAIYKKRAKTIAEIFSHFPSAKFSPKQNYDLLKCPWTYKDIKKNGTTTNISDELRYKGENLKVHFAFGSNRTLNRT